MKTKTIRQSAVFKASPHEVYQALMDSRKHSQFTQAKAVISNRISGKFTAYDGGLHGTNLQLVPDKKIVQKWRCQMDDWPDEHYSKATFSLKKTKNGTKLTFVQIGVPEACYDSISDGWHEHYWDKMKRMFEE